MHLSVRSAIGLGAAILPVIVVLGAAVITPPPAESGLQSASQSSGVCPEALKAQKRAQARAGA
jgi:hypothetical protein